MIILKVHFQKRFFSFCSAVLIACFFMLFSFPQVKASADSYPIQFTTAQTLALYGNKIQGAVFNGTTTQFVEFEYYKSTKDILASYNSLMSGGVPYASGLSYAENLFGVYYDSTRPRWNAQIKSTNVSDLSPRWFASEYPTRQEVAPYNFVIYRCRIPDLQKIPDRYVSVQLNFDFSLTLPNIERFRSIYGFSSEQMTSLTDNGSGSAGSYASELDLYSATDMYNPIFVTSNWRYAGSTHNFNVAHHPVTNALAGQADSVPNSQDWYESMAYPCPNFALHAIDTDTLQNPVDISSLVFRIRGAQSVVVHEDGSQSDFTYPYVYIMIMCPIVWGNITPPEPEQTTPNYSDQIQNIEVGVGDININLDETNNRLDLILEKLDDIYENQIAPEINVDVDLTEEGPLSWVGTHIDNLGDTIVDGIQGLFVPTQTDLINFKLSLEQQKNATFGGLVQADGLLSNTVFQRIMRTEPVDYIDMPLLDIPVVNFQMDAATFRNQGFDIITADNGEEKVRVPLKPDQARWGWFYELLAWAIDIVCTIAVVNMLANKLNGVIVGKKVVELEDDC